MVGVAELLVDFVWVDVDAEDKGERTWPKEGDKKDFATPGRQLRADYAFSVEQLNDRKEQRSA